MFGEDVFQYIFRVDGRIFEILSEGGKPVPNDYLETIANAIRIKHPETEVVTVTQVVSTVVIRT